MHGGGHAGDGPDYPAVVEEMESKITELEDDCSRLLAALEDANLVAEEQESIARDKALRLKELTELHRNSGVPLGSEMSQDEVLFFYFSFFPRARCVVVRKRSRTKPIRGGKKRAKKGRQHPES